MRIGDPCFTSPPHVVLSPADGDGFPADGGFASRRYPQIKQIFWDFDDDGSQMPMTSVIHCPICGICVTNNHLLRETIPPAKSVQSAESV